MPTDRERAKIGLLPLYLKALDDREPQRRQRVEAFYRQIASELDRRGVEVLTSPLARLRPEFEDAVRGFERSGAEAIVTLHLAYCPSLESAESLARSPLPLIVCDTTPAPSCGPEQDPRELTYNHGTQGVRDLCNLLLRYGKPFHVEAGHWQKSDVLKRTYPDSIDTWLSTMVRRRGRNGDGRETQELHTGVQGRGGTIAGDQRQGWPRA